MAMKKVNARMVAILVCVLLGGCVWPEPKPGEPVPTIHVTTDWSAANQTVTLSVDVEHLSPHTVRLYQWILWRLRCRGLHGAVFLHTGRERVFHRHA